MQTRHAAMEIDAGIARMRELFSIEIVAGGEALSDSMCTGFVWSDHPGTVVLAANRKYFAAAVANPCVSVIVAPADALDSDAPGKTLIVTPHADECFYFFHNRLLNAPAHEPHPVPYVHPEAILGHGVQLGNGVRIERGVNIGANSVLSGPLVVKENVTIEAGVVIGGEGLFAKRIAGDLVQIDHYGGVEIGEGAFIHSGAIIVRSAMYGEFTRIGPRSHVGVMSNIGHDAQIGREVVISSNTVIAGRAKIEDRAWIGASATVSNAVKVGEGARVNIGAVCIRDVPPGKEVSGNFAMSHAVRLKEYLRKLRNQ